MDRGAHKRLRVSDARRALRRRADPKKAKLLQRFFKTGKGEYGHGDQFLGVMVPQTREVGRQFQALTLPEIARLMQSKTHEERLLALVILCENYKKGSPKEREEIFRFYVNQLKYVSNWDLVDMSAPLIIGMHLQNRSRAVLYKWARSPRLWDRRIAVVGTFHFIRNGDFDDTLRLAEMLLGDAEDLMHKAVGWMLREVGKRSPQSLIEFLDRHAAKMPRTMLRYSLERLSPAKRAIYMRKG